jgi:hypothetical protein
MFRLCCTACGLLSFAPLVTAASAPAIAVFMEFENQPDPVALSAMKKEVGDIMSPSGLQFDWRLMTDRRQDESFADVVVLKFKGLCQSDDVQSYSELGPQRLALPLASTKISDGQILPFSDMECDEIRRYIGPSIAAASPQVRAGIYGRALGRVAAHEFYHIFAGTKGHSHDGIARAFHTRKELVAPLFRFTAHDLALLHEIKWRALVASDEATQ